MRMRRYKKPSTEDYKLKGFSFPKGFILLQDTREARPLFNRVPPGLTIKSISLKNGDYSIEGFQDCFAVERKQISDFVSYVGKERDKTVEKMLRFRDMEWVGLVIEAKEADLLQPQEFSKVSPEAIRQALVSFEIRYGVHVYYSSKRDEISRWLLDRAIKFYSIKHEV
jgi:ERCC4-type nuclease